MLHKPKTVEFDATKKEHRAAVRAFMKRRAWADSPIRFSQDPKYGSIADQVHAKMLQWYMDQEEAKDLKSAAAKKAKISKPQQNVRQPKKA